MGPALETFLQVVGIIVLCIAAAAWFGRPIWRRVWQFFKRWYESDRRLEEARQTQAEYRQQAEQEVAACLYERPTAPDPPAIDEEKGEQTLKQDQETEQEQKR